MDMIIYLIIGFGVGYFYAKTKFEARLRQGSGETKGNHAEVDKGGVGLIEKQAEEKDENKEKILEALNTRGRLTNDDVEQLVGVSDATATWYLEELEKEGKARMIGDTGSGVYYEKIN